MFSEKRKVVMRIAHLSDVHPLDLTGVSPLSFFNKRLAGGLNLLTRRRNRHPVRLLDALCDDINRAAPDQVVVTGDLSNLSFPSELLRARQSLERLRLSPRDVTAIPGNHDVYVWEARRARHFEHALSPYCLPDDAAADAVPSFPFFRVRGRLAIVGSNSALPSPPPLADGWLGRRQIQAVEQLLSALRGHFRVLLVHHPPLPHKHDILRGLRDRGALAAALLRTGCELVLHGHEHRDMRGELPGRDGPIPVIGVGSGTFDDPRRERRARYNIYTIEGERLAGVETRVHDPVNDRFDPL
jgi:3',5'-cyclic AMP phosphodiesterase CpdA